MSQSRRFVGVIKAGGTVLYGARRSKMKEWLLVIDFAAWKAEDGVLRRDVLRLEVATTEERGKVLRRRLVGYGVVEICGKARALRPVPRICETLLRMSTLERVKVGVADAELRNEAKRLKLPVVHQVKGLGRMRLDRAASLYTGRARWAGRAIEVSVEAYNDASDPQSLELAARALAQSERWDKRLKSCATRELLGIYNKHWRQEGEKRLNASDFTRMLSLSEVCFSGATIGATFGIPERIFGGHEVQVWADAGGRATRAELIG